jgi:hypothetical protein
MEVQLQDKRGRWMNEATGPGSPNTSCHLNTQRWQHLTSFRHKWGQDYGPKCIFMRAFNQCLPIHGHYHHNDLVLGCLWEVMLNRFFSCVENALVKYFCMVNALHVQVELDAWGDIRSFSSKRKLTNWIRELLRLRSVTKGIFSLLTTSYIHFTIVSILAFMAYC